MANRELTSLIILILIFFSLELYSQKKEIGFNIGFGKTTVDEYKSEFVLPFDKEFADYLRLGFCYYYTPKDAFLTLKTGLDFDHKGKDDLKLTYLRSPLGIDINFGKKVQFILGGGLFVSYLLAYDGISNESDFEDSKRRFQFGQYGNIGFGIQIFPKYNLSLKYQYSTDIKKMYEYRRTSPSGIPYKLDIKNSDGFLILSMKYKLIKQ